MIHIDQDENKITYKGSSTRLMAEAGGVLLTVYKEVRSQHGDEYALGAAVTLIRQLIDELKIKPTEILEAIRKAEVVYGDMDR